MIKINSNKIGRGIAIILATLILGYPIFYFGKIFYVIYAIEKHVDEKISKRDAENDQYAAQSYIDRYIPPVNRSENIPDSAFWIPKELNYGLYVLVTPIEGEPLLFNVSLFYPQDDIEKRKAQLIFKEEFNENNTKLSDFISPKLPEVQVERRLNFVLDSDSHSDVPATIMKKMKEMERIEKMKKIKIENRNYIEYEYLEYPQGYLVFYDEKNIGM